MKSKYFYPLFAVLLAASLSCSFLSQGTSSTQSVSTPASVATGDLSAEATSPVSVHLEWKAASGASGYKLEARYAAEFFPIADLPDDQTSYEHFVVPGSTEITYRLRAGEREIGAATVTMPELAANPLTVQISLAGTGGIPALQPDALPTFDPSAIPTFDPNAFPTPDPNAFPTFDPSLLTLPAGFPTLDPSLLTPPAPDPDFGAPPDPSATSALPYTAQEIGPEGGTLTATGPNRVIYTLTLPAGAVEQTTIVALWPVQDIGGLPFSGGILGAVQIWPRIPFDNPLALTIKLPETSAASTRIGFAISSASNELFMIPVQAENETTYTYRVLWGDTFGMVSATPQEIRDQTARIPTDSGAQMAQLIATLQSFSGPQSVDVLGDQILEGLLAQLDRIVVRAPTEGTRPDGIYPISVPLMDAGSGNGQRSQAARALSQAIEFARDYFESYIYGRGQNSITSNFRSGLVAKIKAFVRKTELACLTKDAFYVTYLMNKMDWARANAHPSQNFWAWLAEGYGPTDTLKSCTFEFDVVTSTTRWEVQFPMGKATLEVKVHTQQPIKLKLGYRENSMFLYGGGPIQYDKFTATVPRCNPLEVTPYPQASLWIEDLTVEFDEEENLSDFVLRRARGNSLASLAGGFTMFDRAGCNPKSAFSSVPDYWTDWFMSSVELYRPYDMWEIGGSPPFFTATTKEVRRRQIGITNAEIIEDTSLRLSLYGPNE